mmetsp:Transcript_8384/g.21416  ORF Transcript_8384/g.21416 Transcript_8384/m.21416 type:complete len:179 (-) Transcript_8384:2-538(-)
MAALRAFVRGVRLLPKSHQCPWHSLSTPPSGWRAHGLLVVTPHRAMCGASLVPEHEVNLPEVLAEVKAATERYEAALVSNDVSTLDALFLDAPTSVRLGVGENLYGAAEIREFRRQRPAIGLRREVLRVETTTYGKDYAVDNREFRREGSNSIGRQSQTWLRTADGWRIVSAHVSLMT